ncbi:hypothetical protein [Streptomyces acidicola]|uniref:Uncharacterized protein n=1 Tax=Streptomyces acidicola TaxID=2596892 RepID=A0A5N8WID7_9ACTN|nr:hypothetical protein [Streptomyces acidicola]MPY47191.1 hypothetical protein [Streptomyces acidicola]MPY47330.1 hypothetical protein [Streptomyces acidicola]
MAIELPDDLIEHERAAWGEIQRGQLTVDTALAVHAGVGAFIARDEVDASRYEVEMELKRIVRHSEMAG